MITHLLFKGLNSFNIGSSMFRKILAIIVAVLIFALVFLAVKFTKVEVPNFNRNLIMLAVVDISAFGLVMWKFGCPMEKGCKEQEQEKVGGETKVIEKEEVIEKEKEEVEVDISQDGEKETASNKTKEVEEVEEDADDADDADDDVEEENAGEESK